jgi:hypothetical protein
MILRTPAAVLAAVAAIAMSLPVSAQTARPGDRAVKDMIEQVEKSEEQFVRALDKNVKRGTVRAPTGEVDVEAFLDDFATSIDRLKERFDAKYSASAELSAVMRYAEGMEKFIQSQPPSLKGRSEWDEFKASLNGLAGAYGSAFPLDPTRPPRRMNDLEIQEAADSAIDHGRDLRGELSKVFGKEDKQGKEAAENDIEAIDKAAKSLKSRVDDGKAASGEAGTFVEAVKKLRSTLGDRILSGDAKTASDGLSAATAKVEQAFNMKPVPAAESAPAAAAAAPTQAAPAPADTAPAATPTEAQQGTGQ